MIVTDYYMIYLDKYLTHSDDGLTIVKPSSKSVNIPFNFILIPSYLIRLAFLRYFF